MQVGIPKPRIIRAATYIPARVYVRLKVRLNILELTVLCETLNQCADAHNNRAAKDRPASAKFVVDDRDEGQGQDTSERVRCCNDTFERSLGIAKIYILFSEEVIEQSIGMRPYTGPRKEQSEEH